LKQVLFISYYTPPAGGGGVQRASKFIKYLPAFNWQPVVLTTTTNAYPLHDESLLADLQPGTPIFRASGWRLPPKLPWRIRYFITRWFFLIDEQIGWLPDAVTQGSNIIQQGSLDAIYSTSPPNTAHLVGYKIHMRSRLPWIADFRDPWIGNFSSNYLTRWHRKIAEGWEKKVVLEADRVLSVSAPINAAFQSRYPQASPARFIILPNGYDPQDFDKAGNQPFDRHILPGKKQMDIVYTGSLYGARQTAYFFLQGLRLALDKHPTAKIRVRLTGNLNPDVTRQISALDLAQFVQTMGYQPHQKSIELINQADLLLLIIGAGPGMDGVVTGKIFEYLAAHKPILALVPPGSAENIILSAHAGVVISPDDVAAISAALIGLYTRWEKNELKIESNQSAIIPYDRRVLAGRLAETLDQISRPG
jgi:glycosyltransferase involved in cell wall biosynthesis